MTSSADFESELKPQVSSTSSLELEKSNIDWRSTRTQMFFGGIALFILSLCIYASSFSIGVSKTDLEHFNFVNDVARHDWHAFVQAVFRQWAKPQDHDLHSPMITLTFLIDHIVFSAHYAAYHTTNVLIFAASAVLVALTTLELQGTTGNRSHAAPAIWAGLLYAVYPGHIESVARVVGRDDTICGVFYFAALFCFFRYRLTKHSGLAVLMVIFFLVSMSCEEIAVTLPLIVSLGALLLPIPAHVKVKTRREQMLVCGSLWMALGLFAVVKQAIVGVTIGGTALTGTGFDPESVHGATSFDTIKQILIPKSKGASAGCFSIPLVVSTVVTAVCGALQGRKELRIYLFLIAWMILAMIPGFKLWKQHPDLMGCKIFFVSSAPLCIALALAGTAAFARSSTMSVRTLTYVGLVALLVLFSSWSGLLTVDLSPWLAANK